MNKHNIPYGKQSIEQDYIKKFNAVKVKEDYSYNSGENSSFETVETLRNKIKNIKK
ncbi:MAG: hypothetical protein ABGW56_00945 [Flavobacteriaceae bacterium]